MPFSCASEKGWKVKGGTKRGSKEPDPVTSPYLEEFTGRKPVK